MQCGKSLVTSQTEQMAQKEPELYFISFVETSSSASSFSSLAVSTERERLKIRFNKNLNITVKLAIVR